MTEKAIKVNDDWLSERIASLKISNDDKIYLHHFVKARKDSNHIGAASIWFVFLEKYLRTKLVMHFVKSEVGSEERLNALDRIEKQIEDWEQWTDQYNGKLSELNNLIRSYGTSNSPAAAELHAKLDKYLSHVDGNGPAPRGQYSFNNICSELIKARLLEKDFGKDLKSLYAKFRTPIQHWLFKRLFETMWLWGTVPVAAANFTDGGVRMIEVAENNMVFRETNLLPIMEHISNETFLAICGLLVKSDEVVEPSWI